MTTRNSKRKGIEL